VRDELFAQLRDLETLAREIRQLLQQEPGAIEEARGEDALRVAAALLSARDTNTTLAPLQQELYLRSLRRAAERSEVVRDAAQADLERALGNTPRPTPHLQAGIAPRRRRDEGTQKEQRSGQPEAALPVGFDELKPRLLEGVTTLFRRFVPGGKAAEDLTAATFKTVWRGWDTICDSPFQEAHVYRAACKRLIAHFGGRLPSLKEPKLLALLRSVREFERQIAQVEAESGEGGAGSVRATVDRLVGEFYNGLFPLPSPPKSKQDDGGDDDTPDAGIAALPVSPRPGPVLADAVAMPVEQRVAQAA